jgi:hypothetical protein
MRLSREFQLLIACSRLPPAGQPSLDGLRQLGAVVPGDVAAELKALAGFAARSRVRWQLFGDLTTRHAGDLDLMIRPGDLEACGALLNRLGYSCPIPSGGLRLLRGHGYACAYEHKETCISRGRRRAPVSLRPRHETQMVPGEMAR